MFDQPAVLGSEVAPEEAQLSRCRPSGWLALELDSAVAVPSGLDDADLVEAMVAFERVVSWAAARQARVLAEFARRRPSRDDPGATRSSVVSVASEFAPDEVGLALRLSRVAAGARLDQSVTLDRVLPEVLTAWEHGELDGVKVRAIVEACRVLPVEHAHAVAQRVLPRAGGQTVGALRAALARAVIAVDPEGAAQRHRHARRERRVVFNLEPEGMASLWGLLPAPDAVAAYQHLGALARALGAADPRGMDARRADLMADLLTGRRCGLTDPSATGCAVDSSASDSDVDDGPVNGGPVREAPAAATPSSGSADGEAVGGTAGEGGARWWADQRNRRPNPRRTAAPARVRPPSVHVTVPISMLMGLDDQPGELRGYGPIPAALAREIAADGTWRRLLTDPESGTLLDHGRTAYRPPAALADHVRARDVECRSPICRRSAAGADLDHTVPWSEGGTTSEHNLQAGCRHDHRLKTHADGWAVTQSPDGTITYTTPTGHCYTSEPHDYRPEEPPDHGQPPDPSPTPDPTPDHDPDPPPF